MAEGGKWSRSFKDSFSKASGDADESFCDPCKSKDNYIAVDGYCPICEEYLCETCLEVHRNLKITRAHVIMDKNQMPGGQRSVRSQELCVDVCKIHHPEIIRFYCKAHDTTGCGDCMTLNHRTCTRDRVQDISNGFQKTNEFKDIDLQLQQLHHELEEMEGELDNGLKNLNTTYDNILQKIATARKRFNEYLDQVQKKVTDEATKMKKEDETELKTFQAENQAMKAEIETMLNTLHNSSVNVNTLFVTTKEAKHRLVTIEREINKIQQVKPQQYEFLISNEIEKIISAKTPLGKLSRRSSQKSREMTKKQDPRIPRTPTINATSTYNRSIDVKQKTDMVPCYITDCTLLSPDRMVVTDRDNKNVKLIDLTNNTVISTYSTSSTPSRVTTLSTNMIAVTLPNEGKIQVLNVTPTFTLQRKITVNKACMGIAYKDGKFAVSYISPGQIDILEGQGKILHTIQTKQGGDYILQEPRCITFGHNNDTVIVSDSNTREISIITFSGQIQHTYKHDVWSPQDIAITPDGVLFVSNWWDRCIHAVTPDFKTSKIIIINNDKHVVCPLSITYCEIHHKLYISNIYVSDICNQIQVYDLKEPV